MKQSKTDLEDLKDIIYALECVNGDYHAILNSREYRMGKRIYKMAQIIKKCEFNELLYYFKAGRVQKKVQKIVPDCVISEVFHGPEFVKRHDKKINIYSCITKGYDRIVEPVYIAPNERFVMFTDNMQFDGKSKWEHINIEELQYDSENNVNRYCKMHPFILFPDADYSIYIDGNVQVISDLNTLCSIASNSKTGIAMHTHHARDCAYEEATACTILGRGNPDKIHMQMSKYAQEGFPRKFGLCEATVIVIDLHNTNARVLMEAWWKEFKKSESGRDQLAFPYVLWKNGFKVEDVGNLGNNVLINPKFRIVELGSHSFK